MHTTAEPGQLFGGTESGLPQVDTDDGIPMSPQRGRGEVQSEGFRERTRTNPS